MGRRIIEGREREEEEDEGKVGVSAGLKAGLPSFVVFLFF